MGEKRFGAAVANGDIDKGVLESLAADAGRASMPDLIESFITDSELRLSRIRHAIQSGDDETVLAESHTLKSTARTFGAVRLARIAAAVEKACESGGAAAAAGMTDDLAGTAHAAFAALNTWSPETP